VGEMTGKGAVRFGFVGTGRRAQDHLQIVKTLKHASIKALCDVNESSLKEAQSRYSGTTYTSLDEMLEKEKLDAVVISTPTPLHVPQSLKCLAKGLHVLLEKPIALDLSEVKCLLRAVKKSDRLVIVGFQARYSDVVEKIKEKVDKDTLSMIAGYWYWTVPLIKWIAGRSQGGGQMIDQTIHLIDLTRFITESEVEQVYAAYTERGRNTEEDKALGFANWASYAVTLKFRNNVIGNLYSTYALYPRVFDAKVKATDHDRSLAESAVTMDIICRELLIRYVHASEARVYRQGNMTEVYRRAHDPTERMDTTFVEAILTGDNRQLRTPYEDSCKTMAVALAANESAITSKAVSLDKSLSA